MTGMLLSTCCCTSGCSGYQLELCDDCNTRDDWPARSKCSDCNSGASCDYTWAFIPVGLRDYFVNNETQECVDTWYFNYWGKCWYVTRDYLENTGNEESWSTASDCFHMIWPGFSSHYMSCCECCMCCGSCWKTYDPSGTGFGTCTETWDNAAKPNGGLRITVTGESVKRTVTARYSTDPYVGEPEVCDVSCQPCPSECLPPTCDPDCGDTCIGGCRTRGGYCTGGKSTQNHHPCGPGTILDEPCDGFDGVSIDNTTNCRCSCDGTNRNCTSSSGDCDDCYVPSVGLCPSLSAPIDTLSCALPAAAAVTSSSGGKRAYGGRTCTYRPKHYEVSNVLLRRCSSSGSCTQTTSGVNEGLQRVDWGVDNEFGCDGWVEVFQNSSGCDTCVGGGTDLTECDYNIPVCGYDCGSTSTDYSKDCLSCCTDDDTCGDYIIRQMSVTWLSDNPYLSDSAGYTISLGGIEKGVDGSFGSTGTYSVLAASPCAGATLNFDVTINSPLDNSTRRINEFYGTATSERLKLTVTITANTTEDTADVGDPCNHNGTCLCDSSG